LGASSNESNIDLNSILYLYLKAFSAEGGIEKFNRVFMKALSEVSEQNNMLYNSYSLYDNCVNENYIETKSFLGFNGNKIIFLLKSLFRSTKSDLVIISHINLSIIGLLIRLFFVKSKVILIAHGIEVWSNLSIEKKLLLKHCDLILSVSNFTKKQLLVNSNLNPDKVVVFPNTIDPSSSFQPEKFQNNRLIKRLGIKNDTKILLTISRLSSKEQYKGYDKVIECLPKVLSVFPDLIYIVVGRADDEELLRINNLINELDLNSKVILAGFVTDEDIPGYYNLADIYVMPSKGEGFGIVFLESLASGTPVVAGNKDGSVDPLLNGELGFLVDPDDINKLSEVVIKILKREVNQDLINPKYLSSRVYKEFGFEQFKSKLRSVIRKIE